MKMYLCEFYEESQDAHYLDALRDTRLARTIHDPAMTEADLRVAVAAGFHCLKNRATLTGANTKKSKKFIYIAPECYKVLAKFGLPDPLRDPYPKTPPVWEGIPELGPITVLPFFEMPATVPNDALKARFKALFAAHLASNPPVD